MKCDVCGFPLIDAQCACTLSLVELLTSADMLDFSAGQFFHVELPVGALPTEIVLKEVVPLTLPVDR